LAMWEKALGPEHTELVTSLNNLALLYVSMTKIIDGFLGNSVQII